MTFRAFIMMVLLATQPLGALAAAWTPVATDMAGHCESLTEMDGGHGVHHADDAAAEMDCSESCGECASCMALTVPTSASASAPGCMRSVARVAPNPEGINEPLFRPPIHS